ncbi:hypothetical protein [Cohnella nanjingensis]|nr:hypothetical protein [Cohnella nanjingensis]
MEREDERNPAAAEPAEREEALNDDEAAFMTAAEAELVRALSEGEVDAKDPAEEAVDRLRPRWEIRIQTERDPVAEETAAYRKMAKEVDDRYGQED